MKGGGMVGWMVVSFSSASLLYPSSFLQGYSSSSVTNVGVRRVSSKDGDKFVPRFDGLRFIETLVTAHRDTYVKRLALRENDSDARKVSSTCAGCQVLTPFFMLISSWSTLRTVID